MNPRHVSMAELQAGFDQILASPKDRGRIDLIVRRPLINEREVIDSAELDTALGLVGDNWKTSCYRKTTDGSAHPDMQINIMNSRVIDLVAGDLSRWPLAGDQFYLDMDLSEQNLPVGTWLRIGTAMLQVTAEPHLGCKKFAQRFGKDAMIFVNSGRGKQLNLRGINARVIEPGTVQRGDIVSKA